MSRSGKILIAYFVILTILYLPPILLSLGDKGIIDDDILDPMVYGLAYLGFAYPLALIILSILFIMLLGNHVGNKFEKKSDFLG